MLQTGVLRYFLNRPLGPQRQVNRMLLRKISLRINKTTYFHLKLNTTRNHIIVRHIILQTAIHSRTLI
jgi:hypothetical protein